MKLAKAKRVHVQTTWFLLKFYTMLEFEKALLRQGLFLLMNCSTPFGAKHELFLTLGLRMNNVERIMNNDDFRMTMDDL
jgi:hypothetical protein